MQKEGSWPQKLAKVSIQDPRAPSGDFQDRSEIMFCR